MMKYDTHLRIDKGSRNVIYIVGSSGRTTFRNTKMYISHGSPYFSSFYDIRYIVLGLRL